MAVLSNATKNPARILGFLGGTRRGGFILSAGQKINTTDKQDQLLAVPEQAVILRALIQSGDIVDAKNFFGHNEVEDDDVEEAPRPAPSVKTLAEPPPRGGRASKRNEIVPPAPKAVAKPAKLPEDLPEAMALLDAETDIKILEAWYKAESRADVKAEIAKRGTSLTSAD